MRQRFLRIDALPDGANWQDTGCEVAPRCLECPLASCRYDLPSGVRSLTAQSRVEQIREALQSGQRATEIAALLGVSIRTIRRASARKEPV